MNSGIDYLNRKTHNLIDAFPLCSNSSIRLNEESLSQLYDSTSSHTIIDRDKLMSILTCGYFDFVNANEEFTFLIFWESFGIVKNEMKYIETRYSSVSIDDECNVSLRPIIIPDSIENCLIMKEDGFHYIPGIRSNYDNP